MESASGLSMVPVRTNAGARTTDEMLYALGRSCSASISNLLRSGFSCASAMAAARCVVVEATGGTDDKEDDDGEALLLLLLLLCQRVDSSPTACWTLAPRKASTVCGDTVLRLHEG